MNKFKHEINKFDYEICTLNGFRYYLGPEADTPMNWEDAKKWCKDQGCELPNREVLLQIYRKFKNNFNYNVWYWSIDEFPAKTAWRQSFKNSNQGYDTKEANHYVIAVIKVLS